MAVKFLWVSGPLPASVHDLTAGWIWGIVGELAAAGLIVLADKGFHGAGDHIGIPCKGRSRPESQGGGRPRSRQAARPWRAR